MWAQEMLVTLSGWVEGGCRALCHAIREEGRRRKELFFARGLEYWILYNTFNVLLRRTVHSLSHRNGQKR